MFHKLKIKEIKKPLEKATSVTFEIPLGLKGQFSYYPGQHLVLKLSIDGKEVRRTYSLNSSPATDKDLQITVKRVPNGLVSNYINNHFKVGATVGVMVPQGRFFATVGARDYKTIYLFAAGSGITPIFSILKTVLHTAPQSTVNLMYGNKNQNTILFKDELYQLLKKYPDRLNVVYTLSKPKVWSSWKSWNGRSGKIDTDTVEWFIAHHPPYAQTTEYYICGPGNMNHSVRRTLIDLNVPKKMIHIEQFGGTTSPSVEIKAYNNAKLKVNIDGRTIETTVTNDATLLQALKEKGLNPPYSCENGICGTCVAQLKEGTAQMKSCMALDDDDIDSGLILTCQAVPTSSVISIAY